MSKSVAAMLVLLFLVASCIVSVRPAFSSSGVTENTWMLKAPLHEARTGVGAAAVNGKIYAIGGLTSVFLGFDEPFGFDVTRYATNEVYTPVGYGMSDSFYLLATTPPEVSLLAPLNQTYYKSSVSLVFTVNKPVN
jgi:hypothetical protein